MKFTQAEVQEQLAKYDSEGEVGPVIEEWLNMADKWLADGSNEYNTDGFVGLNERTVDEVLMDFHLDDKLVDRLDEKDFDAFYSGDKPLAKQIAILAGRCSYCFAPQADSAATVELLARDMVSQGITLAQAENLLDILNTVVCVLKG
jgi:hypothetical protein